MKYVTRKYQAWAWPSTRSRLARWTTLVGVIVWGGACVLQTETVSGPQGEEGEAGPQGPPGKAAPSDGGVSAADFAALQAKVEALQAVVDPIPIGTLLTYAGS